MAALALSDHLGALINVGFVLQQRGLHRGRPGGRWDALCAAHQPHVAVRTTIGWGGIRRADRRRARSPRSPRAGVRSRRPGPLAAGRGPAVRSARRAGPDPRDRRHRGVPVPAAVGFRGPTGSLQPGHLIGGAVATGALAAATSAAGGVTRAVAAGLCYGLADAAIKADALGLRIHGVGGLLSGWTVLASVATLAGLPASNRRCVQQRRLRGVSHERAGAVSAIALGVLAFGESLGATPIWGVVHGLAIATVLLCIRPLARGQGLVAGHADTEPPRAPVSRAARRERRWPAAARLRRTGGWRGGGGHADVWCRSCHGWAHLWPTRHRLAGARASRPRCAAVAAVGRLRGSAADARRGGGADSGAAVGVLLQRLPAPIRMSLVLLGASVVLLGASDASFALARNLRFTSVALARTPGLGPWLEALLLAVASMAPVLWRGGGARPSPNSLPWSLRCLSRQGRRPDRATPSLPSTRKIGREETHLPRRPDVRRGSSARSADPPSGSPARVGVACVGCACRARRCLVARAGRTRSPRSVPLPIGNSAPEHARPVHVPSASGGRSPRSGHAIPPWIGCWTRALRASRRRADAPAVAAAVVRCGRVVWADATQRSRPGSRRPASDGSLFVLDSATKTYVATMVMQEIEHGRLSLTTPL